MQLLNDYIRKHHRTKMGFAEFSGASTQLVSHWCKKGYYIHNGVVFKKMFDIANANKA